MNSKICHSVLDNRNLWNIFVLKCLYTVIRIRFRWYLHVVRSRSSEGVRSSDFGMFQDFWRHYDFWRKIFFKCFFFERKIFRFLKKFRFFSDIEKKYFNFEMKTSEKIVFFGSQKKKHQKSMCFVIPELWLKSEVNPLRNKKVRADLAKGG